jgi:phosphoribosylformylglycinamidine (FGAM) synthase-like enzyme
MNANLYLHRKANYNLHEIAIATATDKQLIEISNELALGFSLNEFKSIQAYFKAQGRNTTDLELQTISQT